MMYKQFYSLKENPFNITSDPSFFFASSRHQEAFAHLQYGIESRKGIIVVTGEIGKDDVAAVQAIVRRRG